MTSYYWLPALMNAVGTRLRSDTTLTAMLGNGVNSITGTFPLPAVDPEGTTYPLITFNPIASVNDDTFEGRKEVHTIEVHLFNKTVSAVGASGNGLLPLTQMLLMRERVMGNWVDAVDRVPTNGLDRWTPTFVAVSGIAQTDYVATTMEFKNWVDATGTDDAGVREFVLTFEVSLEKRRPTS